MMNIFTKNEQKIIAVVLVGLFIFSGILIIWLPPLQAFRMVFGTVFILFLPGFFMLELAFPRKIENESHELDWVERFTLSFALSISTVPLLVYFLNRAGVAITVRNIFLEISGLIIFFLLGTLIRYRYFRA